MRIILKAQKPAKPVKLSKSIISQIYTVIAVSGDSEDKQAGLLSLNLEFEELQQAKQCLCEMKNEFKDYYKSYKIRVQTVTEYTP